MSRCFPFPPPGYQKIRPDSSSLVIKEKHKKRKKDSERKERSEGKEKAKSEKHKDDKDRKEKKHRDKKHKKRDKHKSSEGKNNDDGFSENRNDGKPSDEIEDSRILFELGKRLRTEDGAVESRMVQKITSMDQRMPKLLEKVEPQGDHKVDGSYEDIAEKRDVSRMADAQYVKVGLRDLENGFVANQNEKIKQRSNGVRVGELKHERRESKKTEDKKSSEEKEKKMESFNEPIKRIGNNSESVDFFRPSNGSVEKAEHMGSLPKRKAPESNGFLHANGDIMPRAVSYGHQNQGRQNITDEGARKTIQPSTHMVVSGKSVGNNVISPNNFASDHGRVSKGFEPSPQLGNGKKAEELVQTPKVERRAISNHITPNHGRATADTNHKVSNGFFHSPEVEMGRKTEPCQTLKFEQRRAINNLRADENHPLSLQPSTEKERKATEKDSRKSGTNEDMKQHSSISYSSDKVKEKSKKSRKDKSDKNMKPPHPDLKYLDKILTVPQLERPPISDDQQWLFGCSEFPAKRLKLAAEPTKEVWAEAMRLEPDDVIALPYVIPY